MRHARALNARAKRKRRRRRTRSRDRVFKKKCVQCECVVSANAVGKERRRRPPDKRKRRARVEQKTVRARPSAPRDYTNRFVSPRASRVKQRAFTQTNNCYYVTRGAPVVGCARFNFFFFLLSINNIRRGSVFFFLRNRTTLCTGRRCII